MAVAKLVTRSTASADECAAILREALASAEAGRIVSLCVVALDEGGDILSKWHHGKRFTTLLGAVTLAQRDMIHDVSGYR